MKYISFSKYSEYLESIGYKQEKGENVYYDLRFKTILFSKPGKEDKYAVNVYLNSDCVMSINYGHGSIYIGWKSVKVDMRKKVWQNVLKEYV